MKGRERAKQQTCNVTSCPRPTLLRLLITKDGGQLKPSARINPFSTTFLLPRIITSWQPGKGPRQPVSVQECTPTYLYLFFFLGVRFGVLPLEEGDSQTFLVGETFGGPGPAPLDLFRLCTQGGSKSGSKGRVPVGLPNRVSST